MERRGGAKRISGLIYEEKRLGKRHSRCSNIDRARVKRPSQQVIEGSCTASVAKKPGPFQDHQFQEVYKAIIELNVIIILLKSFVKSY